MRFFSYDTFSTTSKLSQTCFSSRLSPGGALSEDGNKDSRLRLEKKEGKKVSASFLLAWKVVFLIAS